MAIFALAAAVSGGAGACARSARPAGGSTFIDLGESRACLWT
jgi:hypothetical protein